MLSFDEDAKHQLPHLYEVHFYKSVVFEIDPELFETVSSFAPHALLQAVRNHIVLLWVREEQVKERLLGRSGIVPGDSSHLYRDGPNFSGVLDSILIV